MDTGFRFEVWGGVILSQQWALGGCENSSCVHEFAIFVYCFDFIRKIGWVCVGIIGYLGVYICYTELLLYLLDGG